LDGASCDVVADFRPLGANLLVSVPLNEKILDVCAIGAVESILGVLSTCHLSRPSEVPVEVEFIQTAEVTSSLLDQMAQLDIGVCLNARCDGVRIEIPRAEVTDAQVVVFGIAGFSLGVRCLRVATDEDVHDNLGLIVASIDALVNCTFNVNIVNSATIHECTKTPVVGWEYEGDRGRAYSCIRELPKFDVVLRELRVLACVYIDG